MINALVDALKSNAYMDDLRVMRCSNLVGRSLGFYLTKKRLIRLLRP